MAELIHLKIKAMSFDRLIKELHSLKDMYIDFSNNNSNIIATSTFHIVAKDLDTLLKNMMKEDAILKIDYIDKLVALSDELEAIAFIVGDLSYQYYKKDIENVTFFLSEEIHKRANELKNLSELIK